MITYISSRQTVRMECARLVQQNPDIELVAITSEFDQRDVWMALSRSDVAVIDEEITQRDGGETLGLLLAGNPAVKFLAVMENLSEDRMLWLISQGVRGVILRRELLKLLGKAVKQVHLGEVWIPRNLLNSFRDAMNQDDASPAIMDSAASNPRLRLH
jgi:DNA-binding NarL/FixJ family response regulator